MATYGRRGLAAQARRRPDRRHRGLGALMMVRRARVPRARRLPRAAIHVRRGGRLLPARAGTGRRASRRAPSVTSRARLGSAPMAVQLCGPAATGSSTPPVICRPASWSRSPPRRVRCVTRPRPGAVGARHGRPWLAGRVRLMAACAAGPAPRRSAQGDPPPRRRSGALAEQRRLGRLGVARRAPNRTEVSAPCPACGAQLPDEPSLRGPDRLYGTPGTFEVYV